MLIGNAPAHKRGALGVTRSELFPMLASAAVSQTARRQAFLGNRFYGQEIQDLQAEMDLNYTVFDFGARSGRINEAKAQLLAANFALNDTHPQVVYQVQQSYYQLLNSMGQEDAARASLSNAQAVPRLFPPRSHPPSVRVRLTEAIEPSLLCMIDVREVTLNELIRASPRSVRRSCHQRSIPDPDHRRD